MAGLGDRYLASEILLRYRDNDANRDDLFGMPNAFRKLTAAVLQRAARRYLDTGNYVQVVLVPEKRTGG